MLRTPVRLLSALAPDGLPVARTAVREVLGRIFGPPPFDEDADPGDPGLFGPHSASWRLIREPASIVGGIRGLLVQVLHPLAVAGVVDHSHFRGDPLGRLHRTSAYVTTTTFGSTREALRAAAVVRGAHRVVRGTAPDGRPYAAGDPHLLMVVSVALTSSFLAADAAYAPDPAGASTADAFVAEQARAAALLDPRVDLDALGGDPGALAQLRAGTLDLPMLDEGVLPTNVAELDTLLEDLRGEFACTDQTRQLRDFLLWPDLDPPLRAAYLPMLAGALATMQPRDLALLQVPRVPLAGEATRTQTRALLGALRLASGTSPAYRAAARRAAA